MYTGNNKAAIWAAAIGGLAIIIAAIIQHPWGTSNNTNKKNIKQDYVIAGTVIDESDNKSIRQAEITVVGRNEHYFTEQNGNFRILLKDSIAFVRIRVAKETYITYDKTYNVPQENIIIQLTEDKHN